ncbi:MAG: metallophosphoesterase [Clostridia bacterium]|nr:metallophosphoesterase [Clostridia bacterium]
MFKTWRKLLTYVFAFMLAVSCCLGIFALNGQKTVTVSAVDSSNIAIIEDYLDKANELSVQSEYQQKSKARLVVYLTNLIENFSTLSGSEKTACMNNLKATYYQYYNDYLYGDVQKSEHIMSLGVISDPHVTAVDYPYNFYTALTDLRNLRPELSAVMVTGDLSEDGVSAYNEQNSNLDDYYDFITNLNYKNIDGESIPFLSVMGNHDVRGPTADGYGADHYQPAVDMYLEREGVDSLFFDKWINGYHFIMLNTTQYERDDCTLSASCIAWLDKALSENEDGRPIFVLIHQYKDVIHTDQNAAYTFEEVIARHPSAIVLSGHNHYGFTVAPIEQEGKGTYVNIPTIQKSNVGTYNAPGYYVIDVYKEGVVLQARLSREQQWVPESNVVARNENYANVELFSGKTAIVEELAHQFVTLEKVDAVNSVSGKAIKISAENNQNATVVLPIMAKSTVEAYEGYAIYVESDKPVKLEVGSALLKPNSPYYVLEGEIVQKTTGENGEVEAPGWVIIPKDSFDSKAHPNPYRYLNIYPAVNSTVYVDAVCYFFDLDVFIDSIANITYSFQNALGETILEEQAIFGSDLNVPADQTKDEDAGYTYQFAGWDINGDGQADTLPQSVKGKFTAKPLFTATAKQFTYTFLNADGSTILSVTDYYGNKIDIPELQDLEGWDTDGDGTIEGLSGYIDGNVTAKAVFKNTSKEYEYIFKSKDGFIYKKGWVNADESMVIPTNPVNNDQNTLFVGWDLNEDNTPDQLPENGIINSNLYATAVFYTLNTYQTYWQASMIGVTMQNATQASGEHLKLQAQSWASSPTGSAVVASWNGMGLKGENKKQLSSPYFTLPIPTDKGSNGFALWLDVGDNDGYAFTLYKQNKAINSGNVYALSTDGETYTLNASSAISLPNSFKGWLLIPTASFGSAANLEEGQYLQILFDFNAASTDTEKQIAFGAAIQFNNSVQTVIDSLSKNFFSFTNYDGSVISYGVLNQTTPLNAPTAPSRPNDSYYTYTFAGWDINGDNVADELPQYLTASVYATAVYNVEAVQFTYKFVDENNNLLLEKTADYNSLILPLFNYKGSVDENHILKITYLDYEEGMLLTENVTFTVKLEEIKKTFTYKFLVDDWVYAYGTVEFDQPVPKPQDPVKEGYEFVKWKGYSEEDLLFYDDEFTAMFKEAEEIPEENSSTTSSSISSSEEQNTPSALPLILGISAGIIVIAVIAILIVLKKRKSN